MDIITGSWHNCYSQSWGQEIVPEAYSHPAKFARGLIRRIYAHALEQGYLKPNDWVIDCFAGVGLGAADAVANGLNWFGNELEISFVDMGSGCNCTGISKADWVRCFGRWKRFAHTNGRHWCPRCLAEAGLVLEDWEPALPGMEVPTTSYKRSSGKIPHTEPHRYAGNLDLFARHARGGATAVLVQGDSRRLCEVLEGARAEGLISSPPWESNLCRDGRGTNLKIHDQLEEKYHRHYGERSFPKETYGDSDGQLGTMPTGEPPAGIVSSPPWEASLESKDTEFQAKARPGRTIQRADYGLHPDQLGNQQGDTFWSAAKIILLQCHAVLAPGGVAIFVCKRFVRDKKIVEFSQQWADLCQSCGFELVEWIKAWLVEERGTQYDLEGEAHTKTIKRFSFFRRLHAQKYPHLAIEWEDVLIFRKAREGA